MRISTKGRHAVMAMVDLARNGGEKLARLRATHDRGGALHGRWTDPVRRDDDAREARSVEAVFVFQKLGET